MLSIVAAVVVDFGVDICVYISDTRSVEKDIFDKNSYMNKKDAFVLLAFNIQEIRYKIKRFLFPDDFVFVTF